MQNKKFTFFILSDEYALRIYVHNQSILDKILLNIELKSYECYRIFK